MESPFDDYVGSLGSVPLFPDAEGVKDAFVHLLWGDGVTFIDATESNGRRHVRARGLQGWVRTADLGGAPLLELYFIDVGQGDGVLVRTPDFRHLLIDGGFPRSSQPSTKSAADFVDWKFAKDYGVDTIQLDALIASHNDHDHYGGLDDLLDVAQTDELDAKGVTVESFYHAGLSWWKDENGDRSLGPLLPENGNPQYFVRLLEDRPMAEAATDGQSAPQLQGAWSKFISKVVAARTADGSKTPISRVSHTTGHLPGFEATGGDAVSIEVLGPIEWEQDGRPALRRLGGDSISTNGHSVLLRLAYGKARFVLTGDLNKAAHDELLEHYSDRPEVFACDVAKSCHHGSEDVSMRFLQAMQPAATVISSGDAEGHDHPRPRIVAACGVVGHLTVEDDRLLTPLVYSTELARSYELGKVGSATLPNGDELEGEALGLVRLGYRVHKPGTLRPKSGNRNLGGSFVVSGLVYGLVNVRSDGETVLCATRNEGKGGWSIKTFPARFG